MSAAESLLQQQVHNLYSDHHGWLLGWLRNKLGCAHHAADVTHDTFVRIIASRDALLGMREPRAYLTTTAQRLMLDRSRRRQVEQAYLAELTPLMNDGRCGPSPEETLMALQALEQIGAALAGLPARASQAFLLHYLDQRPHADVAAQLGVSVRMVQKYLVQALLQCRAACPALAE